MALISISGLSTGIDYATLIEQMVKVESFTLNRIASKKSGYEQKTAAYSDLISSVEALKSAADNLRLSSGFQNKTTTVSDETIFTANASTTATTGNYNIVVHELALSHKFISGSGVTAEDATVASGSGQFVFKIGDSGTEQSVAVDNTTTLDELKTAINSLDAGVNATIINEGTGATPYRLILSTTDTGEDNKIIVTQDDTDLNFDVNDTTLASANHLQTPQDAQIEIDGFTVYRTSNTVTDLVPGVTLFLHKSDPATTASLSVERDLEAIQENIGSLVEAYQEVIIRNIKDPIVPVKVSRYKYQLNFVFWPVQQFILSCKLQYRIVCFIIEMMR